MISNATGRGFNPKVVSPFILRFIPQGGFNPKVVSPFILRFIPQGGIRETFFLRRQRAVAGSQQNSSGIHQMPLQILIEFPFLCLSEKRFWRDYFLALFGYGDGLVFTRLR